MLLVNVPESDFLMPGKAKQTKTVQPSLRIGRQADFGRGRGRIRPTGGRYMSQRSTADYVDSQLVPSFNESVYYGIDGGAGYVNNSAGFVNVNAAPQAYNLGPQQQQPQGFGMNVNGHSSGPLGHVGDSRGMPAPFQQVGVARLPQHAVQLETKVYSVLCSNPFCRLSCYPQAAGVPELLACSVWPVTHIRCILYIVCPVMLSWHFCSKPICPNFRATKLLKPHDCVQGANLGEHHFNGAPGPVFNPGTGFNSRPNNGFASTAQNFANTQGFANSASINPGSSVGGLGGSVNSISPVNLGSAAHAGANPYHSVYNISPNSIPLGAGRPLLNGMGY